MIAPDYHDAFKGYYDSEFIDLIGIAINGRGRSFFPTIGDLKEVEIAHQTYNPYGGTGSLPLAEDIPGMQDLMNVAAKDGSMSEENKELLAKFLKGIDKEMPCGESGQNDSRQPQNQ